jgi:hypothetical protein
VKTKKWPSTIVFKPSKFSDEAQSFLSLPNFQMKPGHLLEEVIAFTAD